MSTICNTQSHLPPLLRPPSVLPASAMPPRKRRPTQAPTEGQAVLPTDHDDRPISWISGQAGQEQEDESPLHLTFLLPPPRLRPLLPLPTSQPSQRLQRKKRRVSSSPSSSSSSASSSTSVASTSSVSAYPTPTEPPFIRYNIERDTPRSAAALNRRYNAEDFPHNYGQAPGGNTWTLVDCWTLHGRSHCPVRSQYAICVVKEY